MLSRSIAAGMKLVRAEVVGVGVAAGRISSVRLDNGAEIITTSFVNAAGPMLARVARLVGVDLPVWSEAHDKLVFRDSIGAIPREAPMIIWADPQRLTWSSEEAHLLSEDGRRDLLEEMPAQCHGRPEGGTDSPWFVALWEYQHRVLDPVWPMPEDPLFPEVVMRGLTTMVPGLSPYLQHLPQPFVDGGYYTKTADNRPLAGPMGVEGAYVAGALSGYGVMAAAAVAELVGAHITGSRLPDYATSFSLERISDPEYVRELATLIDTGQL
jgi:glycine/D-amino acid oxidase-like deaminating enzyme